MGLIKAILEAIHGEDNRIAGRAITQLSAVLLSTNTTSMIVNSTIGFGELYDGTLQARVMIDDEIIDAATRTQTPGDMRFLSLTRGVLGTKIQDHSPGAVVYDLSENTSTIHLAKRGFLLRYAQAEDLDVIGRNLGLHKCRGIDQETWRRVIQAMAYLPKQTIHAFECVLTAYFNNTTSWELYTKPQDPYRVYVRVTLPLSTTVRGRFYLNHSAERLTTGLTTVTTTRAIRTVAGVYLNTLAARRGMRQGMTNYFTAGSFVLGSTTITLGSSPGAIGTDVIVDYAAYNGTEATRGHHYLAPNELARDSDDRYAYLSDPAATIRCLLNQVRPSATQVYVSLRS